MAAQDEKGAGREHGQDASVEAVGRRAKVGPGERMSRFLRHFTVVGDDCQSWQANCRKWEQQQPQPPAPQASGQEGGAADPGAAPAPAPRPPPDLRSSLRKLFRSQGFQVVVICLVVMDALLVLAELLLDLRVVRPDRSNWAARVAHYVSIAILGSFLLEISLKVFVFRLEFFRHRFEVLDAVVVVVSFVLDVVLLFRKHALEAFGLLILLRLWRVARIVNGIIISVKTRSERKLLRLKQMNSELAAKVQLLEVSCSEKEQEIERLNKLLRQHGLVGEVN